MTVINREVDVEGVAAYPADPQVTFPPASMLVIALESLADDAYFSLTGAVGDPDECHLVPNTPTARIVLFGPYEKIWLRAGTPGVDPVVVQVTAEN